MVGFLIRLVSLVAISTAIIALYELHPWAALGFIGGFLNALAIDIVRLVNR